MNETTITETCGCGATFTADDGMSWAYTVPDDAQEGAQ